MLVEFRVENHRSIRDEQVLSLEAGLKREAASDPAAREIAGSKKPLLPVAAIYGANASGKSNILTALRFMKIAVMNSHRRWDPEAGVLRTPFAWGDSPSKPSTFEVDVVVNGVRYQYGFVANDELFLEEWLYAWPKGRKQTWLQREGESYKFGAHLEGDNRVVQDATRPNALFLSAAVQLKRDQLHPLFSWFYKMKAVRVDRPLPHSILLNPLRKHERFVDLLRAADVGITGMKAGKETGRQRIMLRHGSPSGDAWLDLNEESEGTRTLFGMAPSIFHVLDHGGLMVVDELECSLHPLVAAKLIEQFNDPHLNPKNAQILFTTHDTSLLSSLRRDQIWITEKDQEGATSLYPLTDYAPRKNENLERGYLLGRYGGTPVLNDLVRPQR